MIPLVTIDNKMIVEKFSKTPKNERKSCENKNVEEKTGSLTEKKKNSANHFDDSDC